MSRFTFACVGCNKSIYDARTSSEKKQGCDISCPFCSTVQTAQVPMAQSRMEHVQNTPANQMAKGGSPSRLGDAIGMFVIILIVCVVFMGLFAPIGIILGTAAVLFCLFFGTGYLITTVGTDFVHRNDPEYQAYRKSGGQPYLDNLPSVKDWQAGPRNPDYKLAFPEPAYTGFRPPRSWRFQCLTCFSRIEHDTGTCWNCGVTLKSVEETNAAKRFPLQRGTNEQIGMPFED